MILANALNVPDASAFPGAFIGAVAEAADWASVGFQGPLQGVVAREVGDRCRGVGLSASIFASAGGGGAGGGLAD